MELTENTLSNLKSFHVRLSKHLKLPIKATFPRFRLHCFSFLMMKMVPILIAPFSNECTINTIGF